MMWHINYVVLVLMMTYVLMPDIGGSCDIDVDIVEDAMKTTERSFYCDCLQLWKFSSMY